MKSFLSRITLKPSQPTISSYGQEASGILSETIQQVMEWLFASLFQAGYFGRAHLFWLHSEVEPELGRNLRQCHRKDEPVFGYRCGDRIPMPLEGFYWRLMSEHPSLRIYQLEVKADG